MTKNARIPNPSLQPLAVLVGEWSTEGKHPLMPNVAIHGNVAFEWIEGGAFLKMYSETDQPQIPTGIAIFGSDGDSNSIYMLYFDSRGVSRKYDFNIGGNQWKWWRDDPKFSQRFTVQIEDHGNSMVSKGEMRRDGAEWEGDLELIYTRVK